MVEERQFKHHGDSQMDKRRQFIDRLYGKELNDFSVSHPGFQIPVQSNSMGRKVTSNRRTMLQTA